MTFLIALFGALTGAASLILHVLARRYPKLAPIASDVDQVETVLSDASRSVASATASTK